MKKLSFSVIILIILGLLFMCCQKGPSNPLETTLSGSNTPALAKADTYTDNQMYPVDMTVWVPCAVGGAGESVQLSGTMHSLYHYTIDANGGVHIKWHNQPQNLTGVGLTTGDKYQGTGVTQDVGNTKVGETYTYVNNFRMIGQGPGNNYLVHETYHITINANGELTASVDNYKVECK
jgi:hypothetical protein